MLCRQMRKAGKIQINTAGSRTVSRQQYAARIILDGLATKVDVVPGDTMLGLDVFSRYNSIWNFSNADHAVTVNRGQGELDDSDLSQ